MKAVLAPGIYAFYLITILSVGDFGDGYLFSMVFHIDSDGNLGSCCSGSVKTWTEKTCENGHLNDFLNCSNDSGVGMYKLKNLPIFITMLLIFSFLTCGVRASIFGEFTMENTFEWKKETPEEHGMSESKLDLLRDILADRGTKTFLVVRHDKIIYEWYSPDFDSTKPHYTASLAKALVGGMSLIIALNDGLISVDDLAWKYIPSWKDDPKKSKITIRHLATHSSGIEDAEEDSIPHEQLTGWKGISGNRNRIHSP